MKFRALLVLGGLVSIGTGLAAIFAPVLLRSALGLGEGSDAFNALARLYGGVVISVGAAYLVAASDPVRRRALLLPLVLVPLSDLVAGLAGIAFAQMSAVRAGAFVVVDGLYVLAFLRWMPRSGRAEKESRQTLE